MLIRRTQRFCTNDECGKLLELKQGESIKRFFTRLTCDTFCAEQKRRKRKYTTDNFCFCGRLRTELDSPFCCWEHRLIHIKCKQWGIPSTINGYENHKNMLEQEQSKINKQCRKD